MKRILVVAPHPDDETLGCGGTLLRHKQKGDHISWLIVTHMSEETGYSPERIASREREIEAVKVFYDFDSVYNLELKPAGLDVYPVGELVSKFSRVITAEKPETIYLPYRLDAHSDHTIVFDAVASCCKSFRYPFLKQVRSYETLSETGFGVRPEDSGFNPNIYVDITGFIDQKIEAMNNYEGEMGQHPFPRSDVTLRALATLRGSFAGVHFAEAFVSLLEIEK
jgi:LmbE family N-acetylglucosaminyl deacetylase